MNRYMAVLGFNTKQWWIYDEIEDVYIDIPIEVLNEVHSKYGTIRENVEQQEQYLNTLVNSDNKPKWLEDKAYFYKEIE